MRMTLCGDITIHVHHHLVPDPRVGEILTGIRQLLQQGTTTMATLADIAAQVSEQTTIINSVIVFIDELNAKWEAAKADNDPAAKQAIFDELVAQKATIAAAVAKNTAAEGEPPAPVV